MPSTLDSACFREIALPESIKSVYAVEEGLDYLSNLSRLNVFIGPNNSGKSRLIRALFAEHNLAISNGDEPGASFREAKELLRTVYAQVSRFDSPSSDEEAWKSRAEYLFKRMRPPFRKVRTGIYEIDKDVVTRLRSCSDKRIHFQEAIPDNFYDVLRIASHRLDEEMEADRRGNRGPLEVVRTYIPSLRGLRPVFGGQFGDLPLEGPKKTPYQRRALSDYFDDGVTPSFRDGGKESPHPRLFTGCELYELIRDRLLGDRADREVVRDFERFLSERFFSGQEVTLIPHVKRDCLVVKIGSQAERPVYELGDGIQQVIVLTFPLFEFRDQRLCLFIEEPELFLHPGLQMLLVDTFINPPSNRHQVFVATHSQHFVDMSIDRSLCSVYRVTKEISDSTPGRVSNATHHVHHVPQREMEVLRLLGVRNSSVFLANCTIWVEGVTDRLYLRHFIKLYMKWVAESGDAGEAGGGTSGRVSLVEGLHYSFVEYGGGNITHYSFLDEENGIDVLTLCGELLLIADSDGKATSSNMPKKAERFQKLEKALGNRFVRLPCREIENLTSPQVLYEVIKEYEDGVLDVPLLPHSEYLGEPLGQFIEEKIFKSHHAEMSRGSKNGHPYRDASGTIKAKADFCEKAIRRTETWGDLSTQAQDLTKSVVRFIESHNSKSQGRM